MALKTRFQDGLNSFQIKCFGVIFMTIDHIGKYDPSISLVGNGSLRIIGRIAAPLFLFIIVNSMHKTKNKLAFAFRLYLAHVIICLLTLVINMRFSRIFGVHDQFSILSTFFYTIILCLLFEKIKKCKKSDTRKIAKYILLIIGIIAIPLIALVVFFQYAEFINILIPNILMVPYSLFFVVMGVVWYFTKRKSMQFFTLALFSVFSLIGSRILGGYIFDDFFNSTQFWMILATPFLLAYNGKRGRSMKWFFYIYYPAHVFLLMLIQNIR